MERRAWPWKKKITEKLASAALEFKHGNEQLDSRIDLKDQADGMTPLQQTEAKFRILTEQLAAKDEVVLQHARVAEEAVSGWEKAELETASMKEQLEAETQQRLATEDRVAHLDGALKECMRQLRHVREQQEQKIHEAILKKTREWDGVREEMEAKMAKLGIELLEAEAEKVAMAKSLQERAKTIMEVKEGRSIAEEQVKLLQVKVEMSEKEQAKWKYELHVLSKELQIRNEELEYNKKASEVANKQHLENVKKVAKLESECQRLRLLVRKKLPGPAAISQMRMEVEALGVVPSMVVPSMPLERGRRMSPSRRSRIPDRGETPWMMGVEGDDEQLMAMVEENKSLREALTKSNSELQAARMHCSRTAEQLENSSSVSSCHGRPKLSAMDGIICASMGAGSSHEPSVASLSEDGAPEVESSCAESWATALMTELSQFRKEKQTAVSSSLLDPVKCEWMNDFAEMEKLASMPVESHAITGSVAMPSKESEDVEDKRNMNMEDHAELGDKSKGCEDELSTARATLLSIEKRLVSILQSGNTLSLPDVLDEVKTLMHEVKGLESNNHLPDTTNRPCLEMESPEVRDSRAWSPSDLSSCQSEESTCKLDTGTMKVNTAGKELIITMHKVAALVDSISQVDYDMVSSDIHAEGDGNEPSGQANAMKQPKSSEFNSCVQSLVSLCNGVLQGKVDIMDFLVEMTSALDWLMSHIFSSPGMLQDTGALRRHLLDPDKSLTSPQWSSKSFCFKGEVRLLEQLSQLKAEKEEGDNKLKLLAMEVEALKSQLEEATLRASNLQSSLDMALGSKEALMAAVAALDSSKALLESELLEARDDVKRLEERIQFLEVQLQDEMQCRKDIEAMHQELVGRWSYSKDKRQAIHINDDSSVVDELAAKTKQDQEIAAAAEKLAECHQTILALGKQLKDLGMPNTADEVLTPRLSTYKSPKGDPRVHSLSDQLPGAYGRGIDSTGTSPMGFHQPTINEEEMTNEGLRPDSLYGSQRGYYNGGAASYGGHYDTSHVGSSYGPLLSPDASRANDVVSPDHHHDTSSSSRRTTSKDLALTSPGRSPGRFLSLKRRVPEAKADGSSSEKHAMGFTRFFSRSKASR